MVGVVGTLGLSHQDLEHRAYGVELGRLVAAGGGDEIAGGEARKEHETPAGHDRAQRRIRRSVDVEQRQRGHEPVFVREPEPVREALARHDVGEVGLHDQLGSTRGAGRRDHDGEVAFVDVRRTAAVRRGSENLTDVDARGIRDEWRKVVIADDQPRHGLLHEAGELVA